MRRFLSLLYVLLAALGISASVSDASHAAEINHTGRWQLNTAKSFWSDGEFPKESNVAIEAIWNDNSVVFKALDRTNPNEPVSITIYSTLDDAVTPVTGNSNLNEIRIKELDANSYQILEQKDGDVIVGQRWEFSPDGRSFTRWGVGKSPAGKSRAFFEWYDRMD